MAKLTSLVVRCRACGSASPNFAAHPGGTPRVLTDAGWRWTANYAVQFGGYWLCLACAATPEESAVIVALRG